MRVLLVIAELRPGGAERIVIDLAADRLAQGDEVWVASADGPWVERATAAGATHVALPPPGWRMAGTAARAARLAAALRRVRPDLVHSHNVAVTVATRLALTAASRPRPALLTTFHGVAPNDYPRAAWLLRTLAGHVIACAPAVARSLASAGFPASRLRTITNGARLEPATSERAAAVRRTFALPATGPLAVGVGRLAGQKEWPTAVEAVRILGDVPLVIAGEGPERRRLEAMARSNGSPVRFLGPVDDIAGLLVLATCFVSTSAWEGLPLSLLEALSLGVPAVVTAVDGVTDVVPPDAALLVPPSDPAAVAAAIRTLVTEPGRRAALSARAKEAARRWSPEAMLAGYRAAYADAVAGR